MYKQELLTKNVTPGKNTKQYIILHHTGTGYNSINGVLKTLTTGNVSCHYVIDFTGDKYKIGSTDDILRHAGISSWNGLKDMNKYSIGIEVIGPLVNIGFTKEQRVSLRELVQHLMYKFKIPKENVIRHKDVAPKRKIDIDDRIWLNGGFATFKDYQDSLIPYKMKD